VTDVVEDPTKNAEFLAKVAREKVPVLLVINKIDLVSGQAELEKIVDRWRSLLPNAEIFPTSAKEHFNVTNLMARIVSLLPEHAPYFGKDALTDKPARFFVTEIIREKILLNYDKEVPYSTEVIVEKFDEKDTSIHIMAVVYVERDSQKGIIIGKGGSMLKKVGVEARKDIETFFGKRVFLEVFVKVEANWRNRENKLRQFGYIE
jgi:GTP-binding protein Era